MKKINSTTQLPSFLLDHQFNALRSDNNLDMNKDSIGKLENQMFSYYCTKILKEAQVFYSNATKNGSLEIDLFMEQSND